MSALDDLVFEPRLITDVFQPHKGRRLTAADRGVGRTPFVGGSESSNSITAYADAEPIFPGGWLTLTYNGSVGHSRYQPVPFFASDDVIVLQPRDVRVTEPALLVMASIISRECVGKFNYGVKLNLSRLYRQTIMVPVTQSGEVDWDGMDTLGRELMGIAGARARAARRPDVRDGDVPELSFEPRLITEVFETMKASSAWYDKVALASGSEEFLYLSQTQEGNGVAAFVAVQDKDLERGNCITMTLKTQSTFYQPQPFYTAQNFLIFRHELMDEDSGLFLTTVMKSAAQKFSWGHGVSMARLRKTQIMVPVGASGEVDWDGMSAYGKVLRARTQDMAGLDA